MTRRSFEKSLVKRGAQNTRVKSGASRFGQMRPPVCARVIATLASPAEASTTMTTPTGLKASGRARRRVCERGDRAVNPIRSERPARSIPAPHEAPEGSE